MTTADIKNMTPDMTKLPGGYIPKEVPTLVGNPNSTIRNINLNWPSYEGKYMAFVIEDAFTAEDCAKLIKMMDDAHVSAPVSVHGFMSDDNSKYEDVAGSIRTTMWTPELSESVWNIIKHHFSMRYMHDETPTDWWQQGKCRNWEPVAASPMMRFMKYQKGGEHYAHYDAGYFYPDGGYRTLMSFVVYLTTNEDGGSTRFVDDGQCDLAVWDRNHDDWTHQTEQWRIAEEVHPKAGSILVFDHRLCHDVQSFNGPGDRIIIRGDITYKSMV